MGADVGEQVVEHLAKPHAVADDLHRLPCDEAYGPLRSHSRRRLHSFSRHAHELDLLAFEWSSLVQPGQQEEILDEAAPCGPSRCGCRASRVRDRRRGWPRPARTARRRPRPRLSGVRNSCEASATNCRIRPSDARNSCSVASRWANAFSIRPSMTLSARASRPTSVRASSPGTRSASSPRAIASAVPSIARKGRKLNLTSHQPIKRAATSAAPVTASSTPTRRSRVETVEPKGTPITSCPPL